MNQRTEVLVGLQFFLSLTCLNNCCMGKIGDLGDPLRFSQISSAGHNSIFSWVKQWEWNSLASSKCLLTECYQLYFSSRTTGSGIYRYSRCQNPRALQLFNLCFGLAVINQCMPTCWTNTWCTCYRRQLKSLLVACTTWLLFLFLFVLCS